MRTAHLPGWQPGARTEGEIEGEMSEQWDTWVAANIDNLEHRMPLSAFLKMLPNWALQEIVASNEDIPVTATHAALIHESLWQDGDSISFSDDMPQVMVVAATLEWQRRFGIIRFDVKGDDRLIGSESVSVTLNPALIGLVRSIGGEPDIDRILDGLSDEAIALKKEFLRLAISSDWCDRAALMAP